MQWFMIQRFISNDFQLKNRLSSLRFDLAEKCARNFSWNENGTIAYLFRCFDLTEKLFYNLHPIQFEI